MEEKSKRGIEKERESVCDVYARNQERGGEREREREDIERDNREGRRNSVTDNPN